jgi:hypothetical protein
MQIRIQILASKLGTKTLKNVLKKAHIPYILACHLQIDANPDPVPDPDYHFDANPVADPDPNFYLMRIQMRIRIFYFDADADPDATDSQHCLNMSVAALVMPGPRHHIRVQHIPVTGCDVSPSSPLAAEWVGSNGHG